MSSKTSSIASSTSSSSFSIDEGKQAETKRAGNKSLIVPSNPAMASKCVPPDVTQDERIRRIEETISQITCFQKSFQVAFVDGKRNFTEKMCEELAEETARRSIEEVLRNMEILKQCLEAELEEHKKAVNKYQLKNEDQLTSIKETLKHMEDLIKCSLSNVNSKTLQGLQDEITQLKEKFVKVLTSETERMQSAAEQWKMVAELKELLELTRQDMTAKDLEIKQLREFQGKMFSEFEDLKRNNEEMKEELERMNDRQRQYSLAILDQMVQRAKLASPSAEKKTKVTLRRTKSNIVQKKIYTNTETETGLP